jgi:enolase
MVIEDVRYRIVFDSRGNETVECEVYAGDVVGRAIAPSGASTGTYEAVVVDPYKKDEIEEKVSKALVGFSVFDQVAIDERLREIDGSENFSNIGGNFAIAVSLACAKAGAELLGVPLYEYIGGVFAKEMPYPLGNVIGGGKHAEGSTSIQEFLVIPVGAKDFFTAQRTNALVHKTLKKLFKKRGIFACKGDEGAWACQITDEQAFELIDEAIGIVKDETGVDVRIGVDVASSELWDGNRYVYRDKKLTTEEQISYMAELVERYNLLYIEDPLHEEDFEGFADLTKEVGKRCMVCGDDVFVTNVKRIEKGIELGSANTVLIKPNQVGTLTDTFKAVKLAKDNGYYNVVSHRSGETEDETIAHLSVAFNSTLIKTGVVGGGRIAKLNELIRIGEGLKMTRIPF